VGERPPCTREVGSSNLPSSTSGGGPGGGETGRASPILVGQSAGGRRGRKDPSWAWDTSSTAAPSERDPKRQPAGGDARPVFVSLAPRAVQYLRQVDGRRPSALPRSR